MSFLLTLYIPYYGYLNYPHACCNEPHLIASLHAMEGENGGVASDQSVSSYGGDE